MDGNRRFAREIGLGNILDGHVKGGTSSRRSSNGASKFGVRILTVFAFSTENIRRANDEVQHLMPLVRGELSVASETTSGPSPQDPGQLFGNRELLPPEVIEAIEYAEGRPNSTISIASTWPWPTATGGNPAAIRDVVLDAQAGKVDRMIGDEKFFSKRL